jgi:hypothetical protein
MVAGAGVACAANLLQPGQRLALGEWIDRIQFGSIAKSARQGVEREAQADGMDAKLALSQYVYYHQDAFFT